MAKTPRAAAIMYAKRTLAHAQETLGIAQLLVNRTNETIARFKAGESAGTTPCIDGLAVDLAQCAERAVRQAYAFNAMQALCYAQETDEV